MNEDNPGIILKVTFDKMSPATENFLYFLTVFLVTLLIYLYLIILDFVTIRIMYIRDKVAHNSLQPYAGINYTEIN
jgi:hypothetical protein